MVGAVLDPEIVRWRCHDRTRRRWRQGRQELYGVAVVEAKGGAADAKGNGWFREAACGAHERPRCRKAWWAVKWRRGVGRRRRLRTRLAVVRRLQRLRWFRRLTIGATPLPPAGFARGQHAYRSSPFPRHTARGSSPVDDSDRRDIRSRVVQIRATGRATRAFSSSIVIGATRVLQQRNEPGGTVLRSGPCVRAWFQPLFP